MLPDNTDGSDRIVTLHCNRQDRKEGEQRRLGNKKSKISRGTREVGAEKEDRETRKDSL